MDDGLAVPDSDTPIVVVKRLIFCYQKIVYSGSVFRGWTGWYWVPVTLRTRNKRVLKIVTKYVSLWFYLDQ